MLICLPAALLACALSIPALGFDIRGNKWPGAETEFYTGLSGASPEGIPWNIAVIEALDEWSVSTPFNFVLREQYRDPCAQDLFNSIDFTASVCGSAFGSGTIAVTLRSFEPAFLGPDDNSEADVVINQGNEYAIYDGELRPFLLGSRLNPIDLRRVILHELGHVIGLGHDDDGPAIMNTAIGDIDRLQQDDIDGVVTLYGGLSNCQVIPVYFGTSNDALQNPDCTVAELMVGGGDTSFIDVRRLTVTEPVNLTIDMRADDLDSVILLADEKFRIFDLDDNSGGGCDARLSRSLAVGTYYVLSNTYDEASFCGEIQGAYALSLSFSASNQADLLGGPSLLGGQAEARFSGGISADNGDTYGNRFSPDDSLDITGRIEVDPRHEGQPGFIVIGALLDGGFLLKNSAGEWVPFDGARDPLVKAVEKVLEPVEVLNIAENLVTRQLGITSVVVDFYFGYGLDSDPGELYFHELPVNLVIAP